MRRYWLSALTAVLAFQITTVNADTKIDRYALVNRHNVTLTNFNALTPLSVGNGKFTFTADLTGLQTFAPFYDKGIPLTTMAQWGWHSFPNTNNYKLEDTFKQVDTYGRSVPYDINIDSPAANYLRANPHQSNLAQIGFILLKQDGSPASIDDINKPHQVLDLWQGILKSEFRFDNQPVEVETLVNPDLDLLAVSIKSGLLKPGRLHISIKFPYASGTWGPNPSDWKNPDKHTTRISIDENSSIFFREMDDLKYSCGLRYSQKCEIKEVSKHTFEIIPSGKDDTLYLCFRFTDDKVKPLYLEKQLLAEYEFEKALRLCKDNWKQFWTTGGAIDLSQSKDPRWKELERRIILSQYLTAIQSQQQYPPQETGLTCNSWFGKFHLEMSWWHSIHFTLWNRPDILEKQMDWYKQILPVAKGIAQRQGYEGARWPKMVGPDGQDAPSNIGPLLVWQQPHPIYYAELIYRQKPTKETLEKYSQIVQASAEFMASFAHYNDARGCFELGPPVISAREFKPEDFAQTRNPAFELAYWAWGLDTANKWRERLGLARESKWNDIIKSLAPLPAKNGIYIEQEIPLVPDGGHPAMLATFGMLPATYLVDKDTMRKTLTHIMKNWDYKDTWGWDYPLIAMTAARLGEPNLAIDALLMNVPKNTWLANGHNYQEPNLPVYLPANGGLLTAAAMMAQGWDDCPDKPAPGFPENGQWVVKYENLKKMP
jgi:3-hydroxymyristoyl/3-hydroxydecanoyl-(acyl carrier protein) dehydratase